MTVNAVTLVMKVKIVVVLNIHFVGFRKRASGSILIEASGLCKLIFILFNAIIFFHI